MTKKIIAALLSFLLLGASSGGQVEVFTGHRRMNPPHVVIGVSQHCFAPLFAPTSCTLPSSSVAGDVLIAYTFNNDYSAIPQAPNPIPSVCSGGWVTLRSGIQAFYMATALFYCKVTSSGPVTVSIGYGGGPASTNFVLIEVTGNNPTTPIDTSAAFTFSSFSTTVSNTITTSLPNELVLSFQAYEYGTTSMAASAGWTWVDGNGLALTTFRPINGFSQLATAAGAYGVTFTNADAPEARAFSSTMVAIKPL